MVRFGYLRAGRGRKYGIWEMEHLRAAGYGIWEMGHLSAAGYGIWDMGYRIWDMDDPRRESASMRPRIGARRNKYFFISARDILAVTPPLQLLGTQLPLWAACAERGGVAFAWDLHDR